MSVPEESSTVVIGNFDGVHRGHQALVQEAKRLDPDGYVVVVTFWPHPLTVVAPDQAPALLCSLERRIEWLKDAGASLNPIQSIVVLIAHGFRLPDSTGLGILIDRNSQFGVVVPTAKVLHLVAIPLYVIGMSHRQPAVSKEVDIPGDKSGIAWASVEALIGFYLVRSMDQWNNTMQTLALVVVAVILALILAIPLGIWAAKSKRFSAIIKPILDFMQTMPSLAYLVPVIVLFGIGQVPGAIATIIFALPPGVRFTELGIRGVDTETVEAGAAFGASPRHILWRIQMPLAMPTVMAGVNQVIMLALSMVVLSGMVGAGGLGGDVVAALSQVDIGLGMEAGLAVVIVAVYLDRITNGLANRTPLARAQRAS